MARGCGGRLARRGHLQVVSVECLSVYHLRAPDLLKSHVEFYAQILGTPTSPAFCVGEDKTIVVSPWDLLKQPFGDLPACRIFRWVVVNVLVTRKERKALRKCHFGSVGLFQPQAAFDSFD